MEKTLIHQDKDNKHYQIQGAKNIFYFHHLGKNRNPNWERVTICVCKEQDPKAPFIEEKPDTYEFNGVGCVKQANLKLQELV